MEFKLKCQSCGHEYWRKGVDDPETNAWEITDKREGTCPKCESDNFICIDTRYDDNDG